MVPKILCKTFNHFWGTVGEMKVINYVPKEAVWGDGKRGHLRELRVVCEVTTHHIKTCSGCGDVAAKATRSIVPHVRSLAVDSRNLTKADLSNPLSLLCPNCASLLRPLNGAKRCPKCSPISFRGTPFCHEHRDYVNEWIAK